jgi:hypothetical protein
MAALKKLACASHFALALTAKSSFAQTGRNSMPSGGAATSLAACDALAAASPKHHSHNNKNGQMPGSPSTGALAFQGN